MRRFLGLDSKGGLPPGTAIYVGKTRGKEPRIERIVYDQDDAAYDDEIPLDECMPVPESDQVVWYNVVGLENVGVIEQLGKRFGLHPLWVEDIVQTGQRPKVEHGDGLYVVVRMFSLDEKGKGVMSEQVSLCLRGPVLLSFQERDGDVFGAVRQRIRSGKGQVRRMGPDYLLYALLDAIVDGYFVVLEHLGEEVEQLEEEVIEHPDSETVRSIHTMRRQVSHLRHSVFPLRDMIYVLDRPGESLISDSVSPYWRDLQDHVLRVGEALENMRDWVGSLFDTYLSVASQRMNEVMKVLTVIATLFIPLTFIAGIYGMNFKYMPELEWRWGYPVFLLVMGCLLVAMLTFFKRRDWL